MMRLIVDMSVLKNKRIEENDFKMDDRCNYCDNFVSQVLEINWSLGDCICKGCLNKMIQRLDNEMVKSFQPDFEEARESYANETSIC